LILRNKILATIYHILMLKCTKFKISWGSAPDPAGRGREGWKGKERVGGQGREGLREREER